MTEYSIWRMTLYECGIVATFESKEAAERYAKRIQDSEPLSIIRVAEGDDDPFYG